MYEWRERLLEPEDLHELQPGYTRAQHLQCALYIVFPVLIPSVPG